MTVMIWEHVAELPQTSVARYVLVTVKLLTHPWLDTASLTWVTVTEPPQLSEVLTAPVLTAGTRPAQDTVTLAGHVMDGGV